MTGIQNPNREQKRMASYLNLDQDMPKTWPEDLISRLISIEAIDGRRELYREIGRLLSPDFRG